MKILCINEWIHPKNENAIKKYKNINFEIVHNILDSKYPLTFYDCVFSPSTSFDISSYPNIIFLFGPHFSVLPDNKLIPIKGKNSYYNNLSQWVLYLWKRYDITQEMNLITLPFGVDTELFHPNQLFTKEKVFVYFKQRDPQELQFLIFFLQSQKIDFHLFHYTQRYDEQEYIRYLKESKYGIWLGRHESQGFALEEALSCNVPLFVWDVTSLNQEYGVSYPDVPATAIPYWDSRCGEVFYHYNEISEKFTLFLQNLEAYQPREFIVENLSMEACEKKWIDFIENAKNNLSK
jgi:hypothetical protein